MKTTMHSLVQGLIVFALSAGLVLGIVSSSRGTPESPIKVTAIVLPKTPQINYRKLWDNIERKMQHYYKKDRGKNQRKYLRVTVSPDFPENDRGIMIEESFIPEFMTEVSP